VQLARLGVLAEVHDLGVVPDKRLDHVARIVGVVLAALRAPQRRVRCARLRKVGERRVIAFEKL
jgi:hypothetical protein